MTISRECRALSGSGLVLAHGERTVVHGADLELRAGEVTALIGPNGSGKSTVLRALARLHAPLAGRVSVSGVDGDGDGDGDGEAPAAAVAPCTRADEVDALTLHPRDFARRVAMLTQSRPTPGGVRVCDVVGYGRHPHRGRSGWALGGRLGGSDPDGPAAVARAMRLTGVEAMADRAVDQLSGGELQRVWLATCLAQDTGVLLLDEPTTYLDLRYQVEVLDLVRDLAEVHGTAVGVVLHDLDQAAAVADTIALLEAGLVRAVGRPAEVLTPALLEQVYGLPIDVTTDDEGRLRTTPRGRRALACR